MSDVSSRRCVPLGLMSPRGGAWRGLRFRLLTRSAVSLSALLRPKTDMVRRRRQKTPEPAVDEPMIATPLVSWRRALVSAGDDPSRGDLHDGQTAGLKSFSCGIHS